MSVDAEQGAESITDASTDAGTQNNASDGSHGYPENTPVAEMTDAQRAAYYKHQARKHEQRVKAMGDYDQLKKAAEEYQRLVEASKTDAERAVEAAREEGRASALAEVGAQLVEAQFTALTAGRMTDEQRDAVLDGLDRSRYLTDGRPDVDRLRTLVDSIAPAQPTAPTRRDLGQGARQGSVAPSLATGAELYRQQHPNKTN
jgi:hypothetical protein